MTKFLGKTKDGHYSLVSQGECLEIGKIYIEYSDGIRIFDKSYEIEHVSDSGSCGYPYDHLSVTPNIDSIKNNKGCPNADLDSVDLSDEKSLTYLNFSMSSMKKININNCDLSNCNFSGANLSNANLENTNLSFANLEGADLTECNLKRSDLSNANLKNANLFKTDFTDAKLSNALIKDAIFSNTILQRCDLSRLDLNKAKLAKINLTEADLSYTNLSEADLSNAVLDQAKLLKADLSRAKFFQASLRGTNLTQCNMNDANFKGAMLGACKEIFFLDSNYNNDLRSEMNDLRSEMLMHLFSLHGITLGPNDQISVQIPDKLWAITNGRNIIQIIRKNDGFEVIVRSGLGAVLSYSSLKNTCFTEADLFAVNLDHVQWYGSGVNADGAILEEANLTGANLGSINLAQVNLMGATLDDANLINANLSKANLGPSSFKKRASLSNTNIQGTNFEEATLYGATLINAAVALENGVPLLQLEGKFSSELDICKISEDLRQTFKGYILIDNAKVEVKEKGKEWIIHNGDKEDLTDNSRYFTYRIKSINGNLKVYGTEVWFTVTEDQTKMPKVETCNLTSLSKKSFDDDTICPNKISWKSKGDLSWDDMMTAEIPPSLPPCIPSPTHWCPDSKVI